MLQRASLARPGHDIAANLAANDLGSHLVASIHPFEEVVGGHDQVSDKVSLPISASVEDFNLHIAANEGDRSVVSDELRHFQPLTSPETVTKNAAGDTGYAHDLDCTPTNSQKPVSADLPLLRVSCSAPNPESSVSA